MPCSTILLLIRKTNIPILACFFAPQMVLICWLSSGFYPWFSQVPCSLPRAVPGGCQGPHPVFSRRPPARALPRAASWVEPLWSLNVEWVIQTTPDSYWYIHDLPKRCFESSSFVTLARPPSCSLVWGLSWSCPLDPGGISCGSFHVVLWAKRHLFLENNHLIKKEKMWKIS